MATLRLGNGIVVPVLTKETDIQPLDVTSNGTYQAPSNSAYNPVNVNVPNTIIAYGEHCDENGIWHFPEDEWSVEYNGVHYDNNIELIPIDFENDEEVLYHLFKANGENDFCRLKIAGASTVEWGFSKDGVFTSLGSQDVNSGGAFAKRLSDFGYRTVIIKVTPRGTSHLTQSTPQPWAPDGVLIPAFTSSANSLLMRYGNFPYGTILIVSTYSLESDNVINFSKNNINTNIQLASIYTNAYSLQRWRNTGWNLKNNNVQTMYQLFSNCYLLSDTPEVTDMRGWVDTNTTIIAYMFEACYCWKNPIDVSNWNLNGIPTTTSTRSGVIGTFSNMRSIYEIRGLDTWIGGENIGSFANIFNYCYNLSTPIDLSNMTFGSTLTNLGNFCANCFRVPSVKLPSIDFSNITTMGSMFLNCYSLVSVESGEPINGGDGAMTTINSIAQYCTSLQKFNILRGVNLSNATILSAFVYCYGITTTDVFDFTGTIFPNKTFASSSSTGSPYQYCYNLKKYDLSWYKPTLDTAQYSTTILLREMVKCVDFYPPTEFKALNFAISTAQVLSRESLIRIMNALPTTSTKLTLTMGVVLLAKLTDEDKAIATGKGWTLA